MDFSSPRSGSMLYRICQFKSCLYWTFLYDTAGYPPAVPFLTVCFYQMGELGLRITIYNIGSGVEMSNYKLTMLMISLMKKSKYLIKFVKDRPGHDFRYSINSRKIRKLGWKPQMSLADGLKSTINWYEKIYK